MAPLTAFIIGIVVGAVLMLLAGLTWLKLMADAQPEPKWPRQNYCRHNVMLTYGCIRCAQEVDAMTRAYGGLDSRGKL